MAYPISGIHAKALYAYESTYGTAPTFDSSTAIPFAINQTISSWSERWNVKQEWGIYDPESEAQTDLNYTLGFGVKGWLGNGWWLKALTGNDATTSSVGSNYEHVYVDTSSSKPISKYVKSFTVRTRIDFETEKDVDILGCGLNRVNITNAVNDVANITFDIIGQKMTSAAAALDDTTAAKVDGGTPLTFVHGSVELPDGTSLALVQNLNLSINRNIEASNGFGSAFVQALTYKNTVYDISVDVIPTDDTLWDEFWGDSTTPTYGRTETTLDLIWDNGISGAGRRALHLTFEGVLIDEHSLGGHNPKSVTKASLKFKVRRLKYASAIDDLSTAP